MAVKSLSQQLVHIPTVTNPTKLPPHTHLSFRSSLLPLTITGKLADTLVEGKNTILEKLDAKFQSMLPILCIFL
jgi:hypothetical protein